MVNISLKEKDEILERIADETAKQIFTLNPNSKPKLIGLVGANPQYLVRVMIALEDRFKKKNYFPKISIQKVNGYNLNVGHYIDEFNSQKVS